MNKTTGKAGIAIVVACLAGIALSLSVMGVFTLPQDAAVSLGLCAAVAAIAYLAAWTTVPVK